ncbi:glycosyltransferase family protein [Anaerosinus gibii]|uniref:Glucosyltransferase 3-like C-terminal domain-containing protein n=1 Tax=Selenobaculum gibii TaxID=3054208 RepID=A0A9Y2AF07_9FIRM|nr:glycosyltransferase family 4 protein [Selenobaculum gbiensis]WIW70375.1 hypothetical protein P3F81_10830 [Selenobaculum gbiensis]
MQEKSKILIIGYEEYDNNMYPHTKAIIDKLGQVQKVEYFNFKQRGFLWIKKDYHIKDYIKSFASTIRLIIEAIRNLKRLSKIINDYNYVIAIDHYIYVLVSLFMCNKKTKYILWSYDIIVKKGPYYSKLWIKLILRLFPLIIQKHKYIIIQDDERFQLLKDTVNIQNQDINIFYLPVCIEDIPLQYNKRKNLRDKPLLLQCGYIGFIRNSHFFTEHYQKHYLEYNLMFHGKISENFSLLLKKIEIKPILSLDLIVPNEVYKIIDECDIGIISYMIRGDMNSFFMANACGQLCEFLRMGKPVIIMGNMNLSKLVEKYKFGIVISDIFQLKDAINKIKEDYQDYSDNAKRCFDENYIVDRYIERLHTWIIK